MRALPMFNPDRIVPGVGWVDAFAIDATLAGRKKNSCPDFVKFATSEAAYQLVLTPEWPYKSRYLLPSRSSPDYQGRKPLLSTILEGDTGRGTGTLLHLNARLREIANKVTCELPIDRDDMDTQEACRAVSK